MAVRPGAPRERRRFIGLTLAAAGSAIVAQGATAGESRDGAPAASAEPGATPAAARPTYLVVYRRGPRWVDGMPMAKQQGMREHFAYYVDLYRQGLLKSGGGFIDESGGAAVFEAADDATASAIVMGDPAVIGGVFAPELKQWRQNPWADISRERAARGL